MRIIRMSLISIVVLGLTACTTTNRYGFLKEERQSYRRAQPIEGAVVIPQNLSSSGMQDYYEVPGPAPQANGAIPPITPPGANLGPKGAANLSQQDRIRNAEAAKIQGHTSAVANDPAPVGLTFAQAWTKVGSVLKASNYKIVEKDNVLGTYYVIDTGKTGGKVKKDMPIYQVHLKAAGNATAISVHPANPGLQSQLSHNLGD
jgi:uncharacterized lipoprotein